MWEHSPYRKRRLKSQHSKKRNQDTEKDGAGKQERNSLEASVEGGKENPNVLAYDSGGR